ncbi:MAG TPA: SDR family oxidoreductase [Cyclobacteriaceae bacterium]|nr:SDR family oxidoreductase [Cyclobacteriaceae bacterium]
MQKQGKPRKVRRPQRQRLPGLESKMDPKPVSQTKFPGVGRLRDKVALITGGDSGIGRAVALLFAKEGAKVCIAYLSEVQDADETKRQVDQYTECLAIRGDLSKEAHCRKVVQETVKKFRKIDILVNNAGVQFEQKRFEDITTTQLIQTFSTNIYSFFWVTKYALRHMGEGSSIINTTSVTAYRGSGGLIDYSSTKGAIVSFTRSLSANLIDRKIRVNGVAPGPIWTPLIVASFEPEKSAKFGTDSPMKRAGQPAEVAPAYLFLASDDAAYLTGQVIHPNGGEIING